MDPALPPARHVRPTSTIRGAAIAGFAVVFGLWLVSAYELVRSLRDVEGGVSDVHASLMRGDEVLSAVRTNVLLGSIYIRDALIDRTAREYYRAELNRIREDVERVLPAYLEEVQSPLEREQWLALQQRLDDYWDSREVVFAQDVPLTTRAAAAVLRQRVVPARESILEIVDSLSALQRATQQRHEADAARLYSAARTRVVTMASMAVIVGLAVAFVAARHVGRLGREIERQRLAERQNRRDLERLSARLVTAQEEERRSLSRELHDAVGQALTAIKMEMGVAMRGIEPDSRAKASLEEARAIAESTLQSVRDLSQLLHPSMLDDFGLPEALSAYLRSFSKRTLSLVRRDGVLQLTIEDDGRGIDKGVSRASDARRGLGLIGMRERAQALSGSFVIENRIEGGTRVIVRLPAMTAVEPPAAAEPPAADGVQQMAG